MESKYSAICWAVWSAVPMSSIAATSDARPAVCSVVGQRAAQHERLDVDQRQLAVPLQQHAQPVGKPHFADFALGRLGGLARPAFGAPPGGAMITRLSRSRHEVPPGHVADLLGRDLLDALDVRLVEQRIAGGRGSCGPGRRPPA